MTMRSLFLLLFLFLNFPLMAADRNDFQQEVHYKISVTLNDRKHSLHAFIEILYINHSPDTLHELWFHLWPNAYKDRSTVLCRQMLESGDASLYFAPDSSRGYIDSLRFSAGQEYISWTPDKEHADICVLHLNQALTPGDSIMIRTPFYVKLPSASYSRLGHLGQAYSITQWYPKPAVYDNNGWHPMPYLNQGEFYSEFGSFDVSITLPENYVVGASGELRSTAEKEWMLNKSKETAYSKGEMKFPPSSPREKTIRYFQNNIHDFAWFADKRYHVLHGEVELPGNGEKVDTWALFTNSEPELWQKSIKYINDAVYYYSLWVGDYPYRQCTAVDGTISAGAGMEYPGITIIGKSGMDAILETVITHEVGHNWFYGILGSNEREHPWMDEGINSFYECKTIMEKYPVELFGNVNEFSSLGFLSRLSGLHRFNYRDFSFFEYLLSASSNSDQPVKGAATSFTKLNYGTIVYKKSAVAFYYLNKYLGDSLFNRCMQSYFEDWKFRHPSPQDLKNTFVQVSGKNLDWFFDELLSTTKKQDFKLLKKGHDPSGFRVRVIEKSGLAAPFSLTAYQKDKPKYEQWFDKENTDKDIFIPCENCNNIIADASRVSLDVNHRNNRYKRKCFPAIHLLPKVHQPDRPSLFLTPVAAWNNYNKFMAGAAIYNSVIPFRKLEYYLVPLYGTEDNSLNGNGIISYSLYPDKSIFSKIHLSNSLRKFTYRQESYRSNLQQVVKGTFAYLRYSPSLTFTIKNKMPRSLMRQYVQIESVHLWEENVLYNTEVRPVYAVKTRDYREFYRVIYALREKRAVDPWSLLLQGEASKDVGKIQSEFNYRLSYKKKGRSADIRLFGGYAFRDKVQGAYGFFLSDRSGVLGSNDYAYDEWYFGRTETEGFLFRQMALRQGSFKAYTPFGAYKSWIIALNLSVDLPVPLPIRLYADIGTTENLKTDLKKAYDLDAGYSYNAGLCFSIAKNAIDIYFPLLLSEEIKKFNETNDIRYREQIRFVFDISKLNPLNIRKQLLQ